MSLEEKLAGWTGPSSSTEQDRQERTERMVREAINNHEPFDACSLKVFAKGSYANNTNVRADSDVDVAVQCTECIYWEEVTKGTHTPSGKYEGHWTPSNLRNELIAALRATFPGQVDTSGSVAIEVNASTARVNADVVPCFSYEWHLSSGTVVEGTRVFTTSGRHFENFPDQQLNNGRAKNNRTNGRYKKVVRVAKRIENAMVDAGYHREVPSYLVECLVYNCPDSVLAGYTWTDRIKSCLVHIWDDLQGDSEPSDERQRWLEVNEIKFLFHPSQKWTRADGRDFAYAAWNYLGLGS